MNRTTTLLLLLLATPAFAQTRYQVSGPDLSGEARVEQRSGDAVRVSIRYAIQPNKGDPVRRSFSADGRRTATGLEITLHESQTVGFRKGLEGWLRKPGFNLQPWRKTVSVARTVAFTREANGVLKGQPKGEPLTLTPVGRTDDLVVLAVPGLSTNNWNRVGISYLDENLRAVKARGLKGYRVKVKTEDSVANNALFLYRTILAEGLRGKRVIVIAHSKGATDTTAALAMYPQLRRYVAGVVAIQPVYGGSPIADYVAKSQVLTGATKFTFERIFKGSVNAVTDLTRANRAAFVARHPYPADEIPTVVVRSSFDRKLGSKSVLFLNQKLIERVEKQPSDGMVIPADQVIPGAAVTIDLDDLDHFEPGVRVESPHSPTAVTNRALDALLPLIRPASRN